MDKYEYQNNQLYQFSIPLCSRAIFERNDSIYYGKSFA